MSTIQIQDEINKIESKIRKMCYGDNTLKIEYDNLKDDILLKVSMEIFPVGDILSIQKMSKAIKREYMYMGIDPVNHNAALRIYLKKCHFKNIP